MFGKVRECLHVIVALKRTRFLEVWFENLTGQAQVLHKCTDGVIPAVTSHFFDAQQTVFGTTSCKISLCRNVRRRHTLQRRPRATLWALAQCQDRRLFHFNANLKKHLPISIRRLLSETECCKRCGCTAPEGLPPRRMPGQRTLQVRCGPVKNPPDFFMLCCWTSLHSDPVLQHGAATCGEVAETRLVHHTVCCACVPRTRVNTQDTLQTTRARSQEFTRAQVFAHRFPL